MSSSSTNRINLFSFSGKMRTLHLTWIAFFISFLVWFNHAPLLSHIRDSFGLSKQEIATLLILNVALTIPARIIIGMTVDRFGPRMVYSLLLAVSALICFVFASSTSFEMLAISRFLLGFVGAGFVIGIRLIGEWFPAKQVGVAEGIYGGWGNFGSAAAAMSLPSITLLFGGEDGWRYATALTGVIALGYSVIFFRLARDTPEGATYFKPNKSGAMEVSSRGDMVLYAIMKLPLFLTIALLAWKLGPNNIDILSDMTADLIYLGLVVLYFYQLYHIVSVNRSILREPAPEFQRYKFKQIAVLNLAYLVTFGSELAVVSMLPLFFMDTFSLSGVEAGILASAYAFMNLVSRPGGGLMSDRYGRKKTLMIFIGFLAIGYFGMSQITADWWLPAAVLMAMGCSFFVQAGEGAVFAVVPLVKRRMTGQVAGMVGAYGNVGAVCFLTVLSFVSPKIFFLVICASAIFTWIAIAVFMEEPEGEMAEILPDGTVELITVK
ncbi:NarK family nitrate/nitrite MFS transporter [Sneathiella marina]|uniref:Nitrate/nitrite transporter n=1 Tax=Sneathiella marina TaxID=2950108 RepID=A0ABY4W4A2_9PROT|nr:NarK family nitrate/nitrite MFS transporter [Sneathiella marina]USG62030.1 NarK family nitrate/nitrite MFS transporter [Sneathiella marina]